MSTLSENPAKPDTSAPGMAPRVTEDPFGYQPVPGHKHPPWPVDNAGIVDIIEFRAAREQHSQKEKGGSITSRGYVYVTHKPLLCFQTKFCF